MSIHPRRNPFSMISFLFFFFGDSKGKTFLLFTYIFVVIISCSNKMKTKTTTRKKNLRATWRRHIKSSRRSGRASEKENDWHFWTLKWTSAYCYSFRKMERKKVRSHKQIEVNPCNVKWDRWVALLPNLEPNIKRIRGDGTKKPYIRIAKLKSSTWARRYTRMIFSYLFCACYLLIAIWLSNRKLKLA